MMRSVINIKNILRFDFNLFVGADLMTDGSAIEILELTVSCIDSDGFVTKSQLRFFTHGQQREELVEVVDTNSFGKVSKTSALDRMFIEFATVDKRLPSRTNKLVLMVAKFLSCSRVSLDTFIIYSDQIYNKIVSQKRTNCQGLYFTFYRSVSNVVVSQVSSVQKHLEDHIGLDPSAWLVVKASAAV